MYFMFRKRDYHAHLFIIPLFIILLSLMFFKNIEISASTKHNLKTPQYIPEETIILDKLSIRALVYTSSDQSVLVFNTLTPQLARLQSGDLIFIDTTKEKDCHQLFQIRHIIKGKLGKQTIMIAVIPWQNHPPVISAIIAQPANLLVGQQSHISCHATSQTGEILRYQWTASAGTILGKVDGPFITWIAPEQMGHYPISCEVQDRNGQRTLQTIQLKVSDQSVLLDENEKALLKRFGWGGNRLIRWPDGIIPVYDATHFAEMPEVLAQWNQVIDGKVTFYLSNNPQSPIQITYDAALQKKTLCGHIDVHWKDYNLYAAEMTINPDHTFCDFPQNQFSLYLHLFSGVAGFNAWKGEVIEKEDWQNFTLISDLMQKMVKALYRCQSGDRLE